ncbi:Survival of motor neuron-related-splicing factor 30 [Liparis tanakae]|uniref:Survival of motor neuron-related-splicing factor 30 n=1 Tax=Liparis tanakae TaxID=230148 RepID=A0A4Z2IV75_9TELE|nr:Survival of motor neuron-related-splicing factor 30 [Liparis tanakae]
MMRQGAKKEAVLENMMYHFSSLILHLGLSSLPSSFFIVMSGGNEMIAASAQTMTSMSEDLVKQLSSYKAQLTQVEVALSTDQENEDLLKLQKDLQEVIDLTKDLLTSQPTEGSSGPNGSAAAVAKLGWKVGDSCMAVWKKDGQVYAAEIEEIDRENGTAAVTFAGYGNAEVIPLLNLKEPEDGKRSNDDGSQKPKSKYEHAPTRTLLLSFCFVTFHGKYIGTQIPLHVKRSIFASPESVNGKVGVGTCGIADKPMTEYNDTSKYNFTLNCWREDGAAGWYPKDRSPGELYNSPELNQSKLTLR